MISYPINSTNPKLHHRPTYVVYMHNVTQFPLRCVQDHLLCKSSFRLSETRALTTICVRTKWNLWISQRKPQFLYVSFWFYILRKLYKLLAKRWAISQVQINFSIYFFLKTCERTYAYARRKRKNKSCAKSTSYSHRKRCLEGFT